MGNSRDERNKVKGALEGLSIEQLRLAGGIISDMRELFSWWFSPKRSYSIIKIPVGLLLYFFS